jgi:pyruvate formate lyase activating enzyme
LRYVYVGNVRNNPYEHTRCPECGQICIHRNGYMVQNLMRGKECPTCGYELAVVV